MESNCGHRPEQGRATSISATYRRLLARRRRSGAAYSACLCTSGATPGTLAAARLDGRGYRPREQQGRATNMSITTYRRLIEKRRRSGPAYSACLRTSGATPATPRRHPPRQAEASSPRGASAASILSAAASCQGGHEATGASQRRGENDRSPPSPTSLHASFTEARSVFALQSRLCYLVTRFGDARRVVQPRPHPPPPTNAPGAFS